MKRPPVTPIFPKNNGNGSIVPLHLESLPTRKMDSVLKMENFKNETPYNIHDGYTSSYNNTRPSNINCLDIAQHIDTCPICSRLYDTDKTLYILAIIGLLILCFLMVKRIVKL